LSSQMRVEGGNNYIQFVDNLLNVNFPGKSYGSISNYELYFFDSLKDMYSELTTREKEYGLCRLIAGYSWPWLSKENKMAIDIDIDGLKFQWNQTDKDWINSTNAFNEIGCIHTTQGYDLNYVGVIFGKEINYNKETKSIEINREQYFDINGKKGLSNIEDLKSYIINIYKTIMYRGVKGVFVYACNNDLREYLKLHIPTFIKNIPFRILKQEDVKPYINSVPLVDISAAAGSFSELQKHDDFEWIELPFNVSVKEGYFVCKVLGESMNKVIPNGSYCLFKKDEGGSRNGKIVLVEGMNFLDQEYGSRYTVKKYESKKTIKQDVWHHETIVLKPMSDYPDYQEITLSEDDFNSFKVIGVFERVLE